MARLKTTRKDRTCGDCGAFISKGSQYRQTSRTVISDPEGQSIDGGKTWSHFRLTKRVDLCSTCAV